MEERNIIGKNHPGRKNPEADLGEAPLGTWGGKFALQNLRSGEQRTPPPPPRQPIKNGRRRVRR